MPHSPSSSIIPSRDLVIPSRDFVIPSRDFVIAVVLYPGCALLDVAVPLEVLITQAGAYRATTVAARLRPLVASGGVRLVAERTFEQVPHPSVLLVPGGGALTLAALADRELIAYLRAAASHAELAAAVGCGSLLLAAAGALSGRSATTLSEHAGVLGDLGALYVDRDLVADGHVLTAADSSVASELARAIAERLNPAPPQPTVGDAR